LYLSLSVYYPAYLSGCRDSLKKYTLVLLTGEADGAIWDSIRLRLWLRAQRPVGASTERRVGRRGMGWSGT
jgi:hypothetical protein